MRTTLQHSLLAVLFTIVLVGGLALLLYQLNERAAALESVLQTLANESVVEQEYLTLSRLLENTTAEREQIASYLIDGQSGSIAFLTTIENLAVANAVTLTNAQITTTASEHFNTSMLELSYDMQGSTVAVNRYIALLEKLPYASYLDRVTLSQRGAETTGRFTLYVVVENIEV